MKHFMIEITYLVPAEQLAEIVPDPPRLFTNRLRRWQTAVFWPAEPARGRNCVGARQIA